jgi:hypothetical protein
MKLSRESALLAASIGCIALSALRAPAAVVELNGPDPPDPLPELVYVIETDKSVYRLGEEVHITHRAINKGEVSIRLEFLYTPGFRFKVLRDGNEVWRPSVLSPGAYVRVLAPGESYVNEWTWGMNDSDGNPLAPGSYDIVGIAYGGPSPVVVGAHYPGPPITTITIVPEPGMVGVVSLSVGILLRRGGRGPVGSRQGPLYGRWRPRQDWKSRSLR